MAQDVNIKADMQDTAHSGCGPAVGANPADRLRGQTEYATPLCFASGTLIATDRGLVAVEDLETGDMVMTADDGLQPLRWIARTSVSSATLAREPAFRAILIKAGAFDTLVPERASLMLGRRSTYA